MSQLVRNPENGQISREVINFVAVEKSQLEGDVNQIVAELGQGQAEVERLRVELASAEENVSAKEVALSEAKSLVEEYDALEGVDAGTEQPSGEAENATEVQPDGEAVPVNVEVPQF